MLRKIYKLKQLLILLSHVNKCDKAVIDLIRAGINSKQSVTREDRRFDIELSRSSRRSSVS